MNANIPTLVAKLQAHLTSLGDGRDCQSANERAAYRTTYDTIQRVISGLRNAPDDLTKAAAKLAQCEARRATVMAKQTEIEQAIATAPDLSTFDNARERDRERARQESLTQQLQLLHQGRLFIAPGVTYGSLDAIDARIVELTERRDRAQRALDSHLKAAEALLAVTA